MTLDDQIDYWLTEAAENLVVLADLLEKRHFVWALFMGHLVLEKTLKAAYVARTGEPPPRTHNLTLLADRSGVDLSGEDRRFLFQANEFNIEARYPDYRRNLAKRCDAEFTTGQVERIRRLHQCLLSQIRPST